MHPFVLSGNLSTHLFIMTKVRAYNSLNKSPEIFFPWKNLTVRQLKWKMSFKIAVFGIFPHLNTFHIIFSTNRKRKKIHQKLMRSEGVLRGYTYYNPFPQKNPSPLPFSVKFLPQGPQDCKNLQVRNYSIIDGGGNDVILQEHPSHLWVPLSHH